jgi:SAM-dependent methyltransferase
MTASLSTLATRDHPYNPGHCRRTFDEEVARLRAQVELSWVIEQRRLVGLGVADGQQVLEPGCGPGFVTERLATWLPRSRIVALDADLRMLQVARQSLQHRGLDHRISLLQASIAATGLRSYTFDVAISRYLFQHLEEPVAAAAEIRRVLRPGGIHIVIDIDDGLWGLVEPRFPQFEVWHHRRAEAQGARGGNRFRGRRLGRILREAGYTEVELDVFAYHSDHLGLDAFAAQLDPKQFLPLLNEGFLTVAEYARAQALYQKFLRSSEVFLLSVGFIAYGKNP